MVDYERVQWFMASASQYQPKDTRWPMGGDANRSFALVVDKLTKRGNSFAKRFRTFDGIVGRHCSDFDEMLSYALSGGLVMYLSPNYDQFILNISGRASIVDRLFDGATPEDRVEVEALVEAFWNRTHGLDEPQAILYQLHNANPNDNVVFCRLVRLTLDCLGIEDAVLAEKLSVSVPSIARWKSGATQPHPLIRPAVFQELSKLIEAMPASPR